MVGPRPRLKFTYEDYRTAPDLIIDILSPATVQRHRGFKRSLYAHHGMREDLLLDPVTKKAEALTLGERRFERVALDEVT